MTNNEKALELVQKYLDDYPYAATMVDDIMNRLKQVKTLLKEQPEIIRFKECKHHRKCTCSAAAGMAFPPPDDWYCADGERRKGG